MPIESIKMIWLFDRWNHRRVWFEFWVSLLLCLTTSTLPISFVSILTKGCTTSIRVSDLFRYHSLSLASKRFHLIHQFIHYFQYPFASMRHLITADQSDAPDANDGYRLLRKSFGHGPKRSPGYGLCPRPQRYPQDCSGSIKKNSIS